MQILLGWEVMIMLCLPGLRLAMDKCFWQCHVFQAAPQVQMRWQCAFVKACSLVLVQRTAREEMLMVKTLDVLRWAAALLGTACCHLPDCLLQSLPLHLQNTDHPCNTGSLQM